jgi:hypothetical protein
MDHSTTEEKVDQLTQRIGAVEELFLEPSRAMDRRLAWAKVFVPALTPMVLLLFGFLLKDSYERAMNERELELSQASEMRELLLTLEREDVKQTEANAAAMTLAAFGRPALQPLIQILDHDGTVRPLAALRAIRAVGMAHHDATCLQLDKTLGTSHRVYSWQTHKKVIQLVGELECWQVYGTLGQYGTYIDQASGEGLGSYREIVRGHPDLKDIPGLKEEWEQTMEILGEGGGAN